MASELVFQSRRYEFDSSPCHDFFIILNWAIISCQLLKTISYSGWYLWWSNDPQKLTSTNHTEIRVTRKRWKIKKAFPGCWKLENEKKNKFFCWSNNYLFKCCKMTRDGQHGREGFRFLHKISKNSREEQSFFFFVFLLFIDPFQLFESILSSVQSHDSFFGLFHFWMW